MAHLNRGLSAKRWLCVCAAWAMPACGTEGHEPAPAPPAEPNASSVPDATGAEPIEHNAAPIVDVTPVWIDGLAGKRYASSDTVTARISNNTREPRSGRVALIASGLDGRLIEKPLRRFTLPAGADEAVRVSLAELPIQSEVSASFVVVEVQLDRPGGGVLRVSTDPVYYVYDNGYENLSFYRGEDVATRLGGGSAGADPMRVEGRTLTTNGRFIDVAQSRALQRADLEPRVGLSSVRFVPETSAAAEAAASNAPVAPDAAATPTPQPGTRMVARAMESLQVCGTWRVQYIDAGFGEDTYATSAWQDVGAAFAAARVYVIDPATPIWQGNLDINGCTPFLNYSAGTYRLEFGTVNTNAGGVRIDTRMVLNGTAQDVLLASAFTSTGSGTRTITVRPSFNNDAIQTAAVVSHALGKHIAGPLFGAGNMGFTPGTYTARANEGCGAPLSPPTDSCYNRGTDILRIGVTNKPNGTRDSHWKNIIAHELGHAVQFHGMGTVNKTYADDSTSEPNCRCDHYGVEWANRDHCIQSREVSTAAQSEGFAHMFATRVFNSTVQDGATFNYYKPFAAPPVIGFSTPPVPLNATMSWTWMEIFCSSGAAEKGVELDWLVFLYRVTSEATPNYTTLPNLFDIYRRTCTGSTAQRCDENHSPQWSSLLSNALAYYGGSTTNPKYIRFRDTGISAGVDH